VCLLNFLLGQDVKEVHHSSPQQRAGGFSKTLSTLGVVDENYMDNHEYIQRALLSGETLIADDEIRQTMNKLIGRKFNEVIMTRWVKITPNAVAEISLTPTQVFAVAAMGYNIVDDGMFMVFSRIRFSCEESYDFLAEEIRKREEHFNVHLAKVDQTDARRLALREVADAINAILARDEELFLAEARKVCTNLDPKTGKELKLMERKGRFRLSDGGPTVTDPLNSGINLLNVLLELGTKVDNVP
jgi:hypothetical protein